MGEVFRPAWVEVDTDALVANASLLCTLAAPARLCAVVKADGYAHGAGLVARAALAGGASWLAVALVEEALALREAGIEAPILLLSEPPAAGIAEAIAADVTLTLYREAGVEVAAAAAASLSRRARVHVKVDTGMHRVGAAPGDVLRLAKAISARPELELEGLWTHFAVADEPENPFNAEQLARFDAVLAELAAHAIAPSVVHLANSAAAIAQPSARRDLVRCGIALYGHLPSAALGPILSARLEPGAALVPALSLKAKVHLVRPLAAGERPSYGRIRALERDASVAVLPLGYHDGVRRRLATTGGEVLIGGVRRAIAGSVTMDQLIVECGEGPPVVPGDEAVLIGRQGDEEITAEEWADRLGTIAYEVLCGIGARVPRIATGSLARSER